MELLSPRGLAAVVFLSALILSGCALQRETTEEEARAYFETMADTQLEAGFEDPVLRRDDALLERRIIIIAPAINARTAIMALLLSAG